MIKKHYGDRIALVIKILITLIACTIFVFALCSGADTYQNPLMGMLKNLPNTMPWIGLFMLVYITWRWELIGGVLLVMFSVFLFIFFNVINGNIFVFCVIIIPLFSMGLFFIMHGLRREA